MGFCFVIQPFDGGTYDKRYEDVFRHAIEAAGLEPYRVDQDPRVVVPIQDIERGIRKSDICFAEVSQDNPNVWFELGYAIAARKEVVIVCDETRTRFPFDIQHRAIIHYKSESPRDFADLASGVTAKLKAGLDRQRELTDIADLSPLATSGGLSDHEVATLIAVASYSATPSSLPTRWQLKQDLNRAGYADIAAALAIRSLLRRSLLVECETQDESGYPYSAIETTEAGFEWLDQNTDRLNFRITSEDLPF